jgi:hypothetical protein
VHIASISTCKVTKTLLHTQQVVTEKVDFTRLSRQNNKNIIFFIENILWNAKKAVPLHADCDWK